MVLLLLAIGCGPDAKSGTHGSSPDDTAAAADDTAACTPVSWWDDTDGDGYGNTLSQHEDCDPAGAEQPGDCDDGDAGVNPAAVEVCDGVDDDCDGVVDGDDATDRVSAYSDADGDGFGDDASAVLVCPGAPDVVASAGDCDDADATVFPGAPDLPGDAVDADCDGSDAPPYTGCSPIDVPDVYPTIEDALGAGHFGVCLGEGTFEPTEYILLADMGTSFSGQGPGRTIVVNPSAFYPTSALTGLTATGTVTGDRQGWFTDVVFEDATLNALEQVRAIRTGWVRTTLPVAAQDYDAWLDVEDSWFTGAGSAITVTSTGCNDHRDCVGYDITLSIRESTFWANDIAVDIEADDLFDTTLSVQDSIFADQAEGVLFATVDTAVGGTLSLDGNDNLVWGSGTAPWLTGQPFPADEADPLLDETFSPPRLGAGSPAIGAAGDGATTTDYWGTARDVADLGAVEF